jgi:outer membrane protein assembly factor BamB
VAYGTVFIGGGGSGGSRVLNMTSRNIYGYDANNGTQTWLSAATGPQGYAALCLDTNRMYAGIGGSNYAAYDLANGATLWNRSGGQQNRQFMSMSCVDGYVYFPGTMRGSVTKLTTGNTRLWQVATQVTNMLFEMNAGGIFGNEILTDLAIAHSRVYTGCNDGKLYAFWQSNGSNSWSFPTGGKVQSSPAVASNMVYFGSSDGWFYALDAISGSLVWKYHAGAPIISAPWPANGVVYFGCDDGAVYALQSGGPTARILSASPTSGDVPLSVTFAARATAGDAAVSNCVWQFGDGSAATNGPALTNIVHIYYVSGAHTAVFTVADNAGVTASDSTVISVVPEVMAGTAVCKLLALTGSRRRARA